MRTLCADLSGNWGVLDHQDLLAGVEYAIDAGFAEQGASSIFADLRDFNVAGLVVHASGFASDLAFSYSRSTFSGNRLPANPPPSTKTDEPVI